jgi:hypothetical protein
MLLLIHVEIITEFTQSHVDVRKQNIVQGKDKMSIQCKLKYLCIQWTVMYRKYNIKYT